MISEEKKLDNPVWYSLKEVHKQYAFDFNGIMFYGPEVAPFGAFINRKATQDGLAEYAKLCNDFYVVGERPDIGDALILKKELVCDQMLLKKPVVFESKQVIVTLSEDQQEDLFDLVNKVQPGYFKRGTATLGNYYGIYKKGELVAVTGERMQMNAYTEISAVVTHPEHTGKGYAKELVTFATNEVFKQNKIPFLHVDEKNIGAIKLYEKLGFITRKKISFWNHTTGTSREIIET